MNDFFASLHFAYPWVFILIPLPWLIYYLIPPAGFMTASVYAPALVKLWQQYAVTKGKSNGCQLNTATFHLLWLLLLCTAASPYRIISGPPVMASRHQLMIAVDISDSMMTRDIILPSQQKITRLEAADRFLQALFRDHSKDKAGLILFAESPYLVVPLTDDHKIISTFISRSYTGLAGNKTAIGNTIAFAVSHLIESEKNSQKARVNQTLLLITDGQNTAGIYSPFHAAGIAAESGIRVYTLGIGSASGEGGLDESSLKYIAAETQAKYIHIGQNHALKNLSELIGQLALATDEAPATLSRQWLYLWLLGMAFFTGCLWIFYFSGFKE